MPNSADYALRWVQFLAARPEIRRGDDVLSQFSRGTVSWLCECGCQSFEIEIKDHAGLSPLTPPGRAGCVWSAEFRLVGREGTIGFDVFVDKSGFLKGVDVAFCANSYPMPEDVSIEDKPYHVNGVLAA